MTNLTIVSPNGELLEWGIKMILRGIPTNINDFIIVDSNISLKLHENGFFPYAINGKDIYYPKKQEIIDFINREKGFGGGEK